MKLKPLPQITDLIQTLDFMPPRGLGAIEPWSRSYVNALAAD